MRFHAIFALKKLPPIIMKMHVSHRVQWTTFYTFQCIQITFSSKFWWTEIGCIREVDYGLKWYSKLLSFPVMYHKNDFPFISYDFSTTRPNFLEFFEYHDFFFINVDSLLRELYSTNIDDILNVVLLDFWIDILIVLSQECFHT